MAKVKTPTGSGVSFSPDPTMNGPYNYTRADIPLYKPGAGYHTMVASPPGAPVTQTPLPPVTTTAPPTPRPSGRNMASTAAVSPMMANPRDIPSANRTEMDRVALGGGMKPGSVIGMPSAATRSPQSGTGMALGGAGRGLATPSPTGGALPPMSGGGLAVQPPMAPKPMAPKPMAPQPMAMKPTNRMAFANALARGPR